MLIFKVFTKQRMYYEPRAVFCQLDSFGVHYLQLTSFWKSLHVGAPGSGCHVGRESHTLVGPGPYASGWKAVGSCSRLHRLVASHSHIVPEWETSDTCKWATKTLGNRNHVVQNLYTLCVISDLKSENLLEETNGLTDRCNEQSKYKGEGLR